MSENNNDIITEEATEAVENIEADTTVTEEAAEVVAETEEIAPPVMEDGESLAAKYETLDAQNKKWRAFWDKVTTGILIFLLASPFLILGYIFFWFMTK